MWRRRYLPAERRGIKCRGAGGCHWMSLELWKSAGNFEISLVCDVDLFGGIILIFQYCNLIIIIKDSFLKISNDS